MNKRTFWIWTCGTLAALAAIVLVAVLSADKVVTSLANQKLHEAAAGMDGGKSLSYADLKVSLLRGTIDVDSLSFSSVAAIPDNATSRNARTKRDSLCCKVGALHLRGLRPLRTLRRKQLIVREICLDNPKVFVLAHKKPSASESAATDTAMADNPMARIVKWVNIVGTRKLTVNNASVSFSRINDKLCFSADSLSLSFRDIRYSLIDSVFSYNDSVYHISLGGISLTTSDGLFALRTGMLETKNAEGITIDNIKARHTTDKLQLAERKGKVSATWVNAEIGRLCLSPLNIIRQIRNRNIAIDNINLTGGKIQLLRDVRYKAREPYKMPQEGIVKIPVPVRVASVKAELPQMQVELSTATDRRGVLYLNDLQMDISGFTNTREATTKVKARGRMGENSGMNLKLDMTNNNTCDFSAALELNNASGRDLDDFLMPIAGVGVDINLHSVTCSFKGDSESVNGDFCMIYDSLKVNIDRQQMPFAIVAQYSNTINFLVSRMVPQANPRAAGQQPVVCEVNAQRDPMKNFAVYMFSPVINGIIKTILPDWIRNMIGGRNSNAATDAKNSRKPTSKQV